MHDFLVAGGLFLAALALVWLWQYLHRNRSESPEMPTILLGVLITAMVSLATAAAFQGVNSRDLDGAAQFGAIAGVLTLPVLWFALLSWVSRLTEERATRGTGDRPVNDNGDERGKGARGVEKRAA